MVLKMIVQVEERTCRGVTCSRFIGDGVLGFGFFGPKKVYFQTNLLASTETTFLHTKRDFWASGTLRSVVGLIPTTLNECNLAQNVNA